VISEFFGPRSFVAVVDDTVHFFDKGRERWATSLKPDATALRRQRALLDERYARLQNWNATLTERRKTLQPADVHAFNVETARYCGELRAVQEEAMQLTAAINGQPLPDGRKEVYGSTGRWHVAQGKVFVESNAVWVVDDRGATWLNRTTGARIRDIVFPGVAALLERVDSSFYVVCAAAAKKYAVRVGMKDGNLDTTEIPGDFPAEVQRAGHAQNAPDIFRHRSEFTAVGQGLLQMDVDLVEAKIIETKAMRPDTSSPGAAGSTASGWSDGAMEVIQTMENDATREKTGGMARTDGSRYVVTLQRLFSRTPVAYWRAEMTGRPEICRAAKSIAVAAGRRLLVFDAVTNKLRWEAKLAYPVRSSAQLGDRGFCMEAGGQLLLWDSGFLTAYKLADGTVAWRVPSVGISKVERDSDGMLYLVSANSNPESLTYSLETNLLPEQETAVLKVDPKGGRIVWTIPKYTDCVASDGHVYAARHPKDPMDAANDMWNRTASPERFLLCKINRNNGKEVWSRLEMRVPLDIQANGRDVLMVFGDSVELLSSWSF